MNIVSDKQSHKEQREADKCLARQTEHRWAAGEPTSQAKVYEFTWQLLPQITATMLVSLFLTRVIV